MGEERKTDDQKIVEAGRIVGLLTRLMKEQVPLTLNSGSDNPEWYGSIKEIDFNKGTLLVTPLSVGRKQEITVNGSCEVYGKLSGVAIHFHCSSCHAEPNMGDEAYRLKYPTAILYHQRRESERVGVWVDQKLPVTLQLEGKVYLKGHLRDISLDGVNACFYRVIPIQEDEVSPMCLVDLPDGNRVGGKLEIKGITTNQDGNLMNIRGKFMDMNGENRTLLQHFVKQLEKSLGLPDDTEGS